MRRLAFLATAIALASCSGEQAEQFGEPATAIPFVTANGSPAGTYEVSASDGTMSIVTLNSDGTYSQVTPEGTDAAQGTLEVVDGKTCFRVRSPGAEPLCYTETAAAADGSYTATPDGGEPLTVRPMPATAEIG